MDTSVEDKRMKQDVEIRDYEQCGCQIGRGSCKLGRCATPILNGLNNTRWALVFFSIGVFLQGVTVNGISGVVISTLERRFHLRSSETGFISSCYEIGVCLCIPVVAYVGGRGHKPLWLAWGLFIMGAGSILFSLPHFLAAKYEVPNLETAVCEKNAADCTASTLRAYRFFFIVGQLLLGVGASPVYTLALNYIDENVKEVYSSTYHGIYFACSLLGPAVGFLLGGYLLSKFVNPGDSISITPESYFWIGNWWIGFIVAGAIAILVSFPIAMYPKQIPFTDKVRLDREREMQNQKDAIEVKGDKEFGKSIREAPRTLLIVLKNPTIVFLSISGAMDTGVISSFSAFGAKYIETMFSLTTSKAAIYFGAAVVVSGCSGNLLSGIVISKLKLTVPQMIKFCIGATICSFFCLFVLLIQCDTPDVAGVNVPFNGESEISCQSACISCSTDFFSPVCGADQLTYVSFCDAGCVQGGDKEFNNCTRIFSHQNITLLQNATASDKRCRIDECPSVAFFLIFGGLSVFCSCLKFQSALQISLRSTPFYQRPFAIGIQSLILRLLGQIPLPIILGKILDLSCVVWGEECGECGACNMYDSRSISKYLTTMCTAAKALSILCLFATRRMYKPAILPGMGDTVVGVTESRVEKLKNDTAKNDFDNVAYTMNGSAIKI